MVFFLGYSNLLRTVGLPHSEAQQQVQNIRKKIDSLPKSSKPISSAIQPSESLIDLADVNTADPDALQDFLDATQAQPSANLPKPVPIGMYDGVQYFIKISDKTVHQDPSSAAIPPAKIGDVFYGISAYEAKSISGGQFTKTELHHGSPAKSRDDDYGISTSEAKGVTVGQTVTTDLNYGFGLGRLYHKLSNQADMEDTGFYVICNAVDKSI